MIFRDQLQKFEKNCKTKSETNKNINYINYIFTIYLILFNAWLSCFTIIFVEKAKYKKNLTKKKEKSELELLLEIQIDVF